MDCTINWKLFPPKAHYLLYFGGVAAFWPYIAVFGKQLGLSGSHVGYIFTVAPILGIISMPLFGSIADRFKIKKKLFLVFNIINLLALLCFTYFLSTTEVKAIRPVIVDCGMGVSHIYQCRNGVDTQNWNSSRAKASILHELGENAHPVICQLNCTSSRLEVEELCKGVFDGDHPRLGWCEDESSKNLSYPVPIVFKASIDFQSTMALESCLYFKINNIEVDRDGYTRALSCLPTTKLRTCQFNCPDLKSANQAMEYVGGGGEGEDVDKLTATFWIFAIFTILGWIAMAVVTSVADALCFQTLGNRPDLFGQQRKWGSIGWGLFTLISGFLVDLVSGDSTVKNYAPCFAIATILLILNFIVCWKWDVVEEEKPKALGRRIAALISEPKITVFILACVVVGICTGLLWNFLFWYIEDLAKERSDFTHDYGKWIKLLQGLISIVQCFCGELPFFYLAGRFIKKFGHVNSMAIVIGTFGVRFLLYSVLENPWWVLPIELLQGLTYGIFYANMATYAYTVSPEGTAATVQGIVGSAFEGIGVSLGSLIGGLMFQYWSGRETFRAFGIFSIIMCFLYKSVMMTLDRKFQPVSQIANDTFGTEMKQIEKSEVKSIQR